MNPRLELALGIVFSALGSVFFGIAAARLLQASPGPVALAWLRVAPGTHVAAATPRRKPVPLVARAFLRENVPVRVLPRMPAGTTRQPSRDAASVSSKRRAPSTHTLARMPSARSATRAPTAHVAPQSSHDAATRPIVRPHAKSHVHVGRAARARSNRLGPIEPPLGYSKVPSLVDLTVEGPVIDTADLPSYHPGHHR